VTRFFGQVDFLSTQRARIGENSSESRRYVSLVHRWLFSWLSFEGFYAVPFGYVSSFSTTLFLVPSREFFGPSKLSLSGQQRLRCIRDRISVPRSYLSGQQRLRCIRDRILVPRSYLSGQQRLRCIRDRISVPRSHLFRASSAFEVFEAGLRSLELSLSGQQRLHAIRGRVSIFRAVSFDSIIPSEIWVRTSDL
jgi:hypothetical protein